MKKTLYLFILIASLSSCKKVFIITSPPKPIEAFKEVTVDFTQIPDGNAVIAFNGLNGQGKFVFETTNGLLQTQKLPAYGLYTITISFTNCDAGCQMHLMINDVQEIAIPVSGWSMTSKLADKYSMVMVCQGMNG